MFEHLPMLTPESLGAIGDKEMPQFQELYKRSGKGFYEGTETLRDFAVRLCSECFKDNPHWGEVVLMIERGLLDDIDKLQLPREVGRTVKTKVALSVIEWLWLTLRLIDRELEAKELDKLIGEGGEK